MTTICGSVYLKINMDIGLSSELRFDPDMIVKSCVFYWGGEYNPSYPYDKHGHRVDNEYKQLEFVDIPVKELNWVITELQKLE